MFGKIVKNSIFEEEGASTVRRNIPLAPRYRHSPLQAQTRYKHHIFGKQPLHTQNVFDVGTSTHTVGT